MRLGKSLGILPVRAGSEGIPGKNVRDLGGRPLMAWAAEALVSSRVNYSFCSTDSQEMAAIASEIGLASEPLRPQGLATSTSRVAEPVRHVLSEMESHGRYFDQVVLVQATSPFVTSEDINGALEMLSDGQADSVVTVSGVPEHFHPSIMYRIRGGRLEIAGYESESFARRQERKPWFRRAGLLYAFKVDRFLESSSFISGKVKFLHIDENRAVDIDSESDFARAEEFINSCAKN